jgi:non-specific serine/threonine protein kinase
LVKELLDTGDLYQPVAWTPRDAYRFLKDVPAFEDSGILVRLPDWWKKRPQPRVGVTIGDKKQNSFDAAAMLDFKVQAALGDEQISEAEWRQLMAAEDGLVLLRGQWVEIDRQKLQQALDHWKQVQRHAEDGISFVDGMRLLAGVPADMADGLEADSAERPWSFVDAGRWLGEILAKMRSPENLGPVAMGDTLKTTLRKYQETGVG